MDFCNRNQQTREHRSTQNKTPARYVLTPTPPHCKKNSDKNLKTKKNQTRKKVKFHRNHSSSSISSQNHRNMTNDHQSQCNNSEQFHSYRQQMHRSQKVKQVKSIQNSRHSNPVYSDASSSESSSASESSESTKSDDDPDESEEQENATNYNVKERPNQPNDEELCLDFDNDHEVLDGNEDENVRSRAEVHLIEQNETAGRQQMKIKPNGTKRKRSNEYFDSHFNHLNATVDQATAKITQHFQSHLDKFDRQLKSFSKRIEQHTRANLEQYRTDGETFPNVIDFKGQNLLDIHDNGDHTRFARHVLKVLFTPAELSQSILYTNTTYAKPGLDPIRMKMFRDAVSARFKISVHHWDEFFNCSLRRSLTQMLCDVRRKYKLELRNQAQNPSSPCDNGVAQQLLTTDDC